MSVFRVNKTKNYTVISNYHFKEKGMSLKSKGLLSLMLSLPDSWNYSVSGLVALSKDGKDSVMSALGELEKFGYLQRVQKVNEKGQFAGIEYNIYEQPQEDLAVAEKPILANQKAGKKNAEKPPLSNTKYTNNLEDKVLYDINNYIDILDTVSDDQLRNYYCYFIENRFRLNAPIGRNGLRLLMERVRELAGLDLDKQRELLRVALINNWKNVYSKSEGEESAEARKLKEFYEI